MHAHSYFFFVGRPACGYVLDQLLWLWMLELKARTKHKTWLVPIFELYAD